MDNELLKTLTECISLSCDVCNSVQKDIVSEQGYISDETVLLLNKFRIQYNKLNEVLDILNNIN